ncbi:MAG: N-acetyl-gamma-glutamyl-phosphate reductase [Actinobacteria bacterium]|nr:N-acetyl-gamma-glutamyl-phosphate reductase [Actinomycetota bacterium]
MVHRVGIVGASGYTGAELLRLLAGHPELEVVYATADSNAGAAATDLYPSLAAAYGDLEFAAFDPGAVDGLDAVFLGLPHGESQKVVPRILDRVGHVVDLGADFRLPADAYAQWYGEVHGAPDLIDRFGFGMVELFRDEVAARVHVAAPGCYPTASSLALAPLVADGLIEPTGIVVNAVSGISGAGRKLAATNLYAEREQNVVGYGLLTHRHTGEIEHALGHVAGGPVQVLFTPHLVPMTRGILATCTARPAVDGLTTAGLLDRYRAYYADEPFVVVSDEPPQTKATLGANTAQVTVRVDPRTGTVLAMGAIDNLVKGASGQAVQALNLVLGLPEPTGLPSVGMMP